MIELGETAHELFVQFHHLEELTAHLFFHYVAIEFEVLDCLDEFDVAKLALHGYDWIKSGCVWLLEANARELYTVAREVDNLFILFGVLASSHINDSTTNMISSPKCRSEHAAINLLIRNIKQR